MVYLVKDYEVSEIFHNDLLVLLFVQYLQYDLVQKRVLNQYARNVDLNKTNTGRSNKYLLSFYNSFAFGFSNHLFAFRFVYRI
jgi:hypothetical protein